MVGIPLNSHSSQKNITKFSVFDLNKVVDIRNLRLYHQNCRFPAKMRSVERVRREWAILHPKYVKLYHQNIDSMCKKMCVRVYRVTRNICTKISRSTTKIIASMCKKMYDSLKSQERFKPVYIYIYIYICTKNHEHISPKLPIYRSEKTSNSCKFTIQNLTLHIYKKTI